MLGRIESFRDQRADSAVGSIGIILPILVLYDVLLNAELVLVQGAHQVGHAVGLHGDGALEVGGGEIDVVVCTIRGCRSVDFSAEFLEVFEEVSGVVFGALEHQVLDQVREASLVSFLVL